VRLTFTGPPGNVVVALRKPGGGIGSTDRFSLHLLEAPDAGPSTKALLRAVFSRLAEAEGTTVVHPVGDDAVLLAERPPRLGTLGDPRIAQWLKLLRTRAPFGQLAWNDLALAGAGREATLSLADPGGAKVTVTLQMKGQSLGGAYQLADPQAKASPELVDGLRSLFGILRDPAAASARQ
jgi:hypothetical protein